MSQLRRGARQALEHINADQTQRRLRNRQPQAVRMARRIKERLRDEILMLRRPSNETSIEARLKALEDEVKALKAPRLLRKEAVNPMHAFKVNDRVLDDPSASPRAQATAAR